MRRLIDANALLIPKYESSTDEFIDGYRQGKIDALIEVIAIAPTVDAVEVVRCKDCQYFVDTLPSGYGCSGFGGMTRACPNGFCSHGERKDNERKAD